MRWAATVVWLGLLVLPAHANVHQSEAWAQTRFVNAGRMREALNGRPAKDRGRREYEKVIAAYRAIYYGAPTSTKADPSVVAVAELMVEMGRRFGDNCILRSSIGQYQFLRRSIPAASTGSMLCSQLAKSIKTIWEMQPGQRLAFQEFLRRYPKHHLAEQARRELTEPVQNASLKSREDKNTNSIGEDEDSSEKNLRTKPFLMRPRPTKPRRLK